MPIINCYHCNKEFVKDNHSISRCKVPFCSKECRYLSQNDKSNIIKRFMSHVKVIDENTWIWTGSKTTDGYGTFYYKGKSHRAHRVSHELFIGPIPEGMCVCHYNDDPSNVAPSGLWTGSNKQNNDDKVKKNRQVIPSGEDHGNSVLKMEEVAEIRRLYKTGEYIYKDLALRFNSCRSTIGKIIRNETWK